MINFGLIFGIRYIVQYRRDTDTGFFTLSTTQNNCTNTKIGLMSNIFFKLQRRLWITKFIEQNSPSWCSLNVCAPAQLILHISQKNWVTSAPPLLWCPSPKRFFENPAYLLYYICAYIICVLYYLQNYSLLIIFNGIKMAFNFIPLIGL